MKRPGAYSNQEMVRTSDIAAHLGLSRLTVSAVLNNREKQVGVAKETADRVRAAAETMGYQRNHHAMAIKTGFNPVVGCLVSELQMEWTSRTLSGLLGAMRKSNYLTKITEVSGHDAEQDALSQFMQHRVAGIFCCNFNPESASARSLEKVVASYSVPLVFAFSRQDLAGVCVESDDAMGIRQAVNHIWSLGHRRIAFISGEQVREEAFVRTLSGLGGTLYPNFLVQSFWSNDAAEAAATQLLAKKARPTAIICANDALAATVLRTAVRLGFRVPHDLSVTGFSASQLSAFTNPPLTSVSQPFEEIGARCGEILMKMIGASKGRTLSPSQSLHAMPTHLVIRESTARPPQEASSKKRKLVVDGLR